MTARPRSGEAGTVIPLLVLGFLLAGTLLAATTAGSAALLARRRLAAGCDGAALAGATAVDRRAIRNATGTGVLPLDPAAAAAAVRSYAAAALPATELTVAVTGGTVTVTCRRLVRVPFGALVGRPHGVERTAVARAGTVLRGP